MKKINIVKEKKDFDKAFKNKKQTSSKYFFIYVNDNNLFIPRFGICVSKKIGKAVLRNKLKRQVKDIIDKSGLHFLNNDYIIILKKGTDNAKYCELKNDLINHFLKIK